MLLEHAAASPVNACVAQRGGPGSIFFYGSNDLHGMKNVGTTDATYYVFRTITELTPPAPPSAKQG